jgi:hypothetical protein
MRIGFTGTAKGMTPQLLHAFANLGMKFSYFGHFMC